MVISSSRYVIVLYRVLLSKRIEVVVESLLVGQTGVLFGRQKVLEVFLDHPLALGKLCGQLVILVLNALVCLDEAHVLPSDVVFVCRQKLDFLVQVTISLKGSGNVRRLCRCQELDFVYQNLFLIVELCMLSFELLKRQGLGPKLSDLFVGFLEFGLQSLLVVVVVEVEAFVVVVFLGEKLDHESLLAGSARSRSKADAASHS